MFKQYRLLAPDNGSNPSSATPQAGNAGDPQPQAGNTPPEPQAGDGNEPISLDEAKKLRSEARALRDRLKSAESSTKELADLKAKLEADKLTETERWQKQATDLQSKYDSDTSALTERIVRYEVERQAAKLGIIDPDAAAQLIDWDALEYDSDGTPGNADALLKDLLKSKPYLAGKAQASAGGATNPSRAASNGSQITEQYVEQLLSGQLPQGTYEKLSAGQREEVQKILDRQRKF